MPRVLVLGSTGQIGSALVPALRDRYGKYNVVAGYHSRKPEAPELLDGPVEQVDVLDKGSLEKVIERYNVDTIYHLAAILSAAGERNPMLAWRVNMDGLINVLEAAREHGIKVFWPSSIAAFGPSAPK
ncbi:NAD-dependent epimerase/dehydratase family protein, partial [Desulfurococcus mucosus]